MLEEAIARTRMLIFGKREHTPEPDVTGLSQADIDGEMRELGLIPSPKAVREYPWWTPPERILITEASSNKISWLRSAAPELEVVTAFNEADAIEAARMADGIIGWCTPSMLTQASKLRWIQLDTAGADGIGHLEALLPREIIVTSFQRLAGPVIAEHAFAMLLSLCRQLRRYGELQKKHRWMPGACTNDELSTLHGHSILIAGYGGIGSAVGKLALGFGMHLRILRNSTHISTPDSDRAFRLDDLEEAVKDARFVVNALPLTSSTLRVFDERVFDAMAPGTIFVNVGRGQTVCTEALTHALRSRKIAGAGLDVTDPEPLPRHHPLWSMRNVVLSPHIAGRSLATSRREWILLRENIRRYCSGEALLSVVDLKQQH